MTDIYSNYNTSSGENTPFMPLEYGVSPIYVPSANQSGDSIVNQQSGYFGAENVEEFIPQIPDDPVFSNASPAYVIPPIPPTEAQQIVLPLESISIPNFSEYYHLPEELEEPSLYDTASLPENTQISNNTVPIEPVLMPNIPPPPVSHAANLLDYLVFVDSFTDREPEKSSVNPLVVLAFMIICFPIGLYVMIFHTNWGFYPKLIITLLVLGSVLIIYELFVFYSVISTPSVLAWLLSLLS